MSIVTWPTGLSIPASFTLGQQRYDMTESSDSTGADAARLLGPPRWTASLRSVEVIPLDEAGQWEAMLLQLRGRVNHLALHDPVRAVPRGTLRGTPTLNTAAAGATSVDLASVRNARNLLIYTRVFTSSSWIKSSITVTANTYAAPSGTTTADTLTDATAVVAGFVRQVVADPGALASYTGSVYVRKTSGGTAPTFRLTIYYDGGTPLSGSIGLNTDTGAILYGSSSGDVESVDADWWRLHITVANNATGNNEVALRIYPASDVYGGSGFDVAATGSAIVWGAQLELGAALTDYEGATLEPGDWLQFGTGVGTSQLCKVVATATEADSGGIVVTIEPPLRAAMTGGTSVTWERPVAYYKQTSAPQWGYSARMSTGYALDLLESWTA